MRVPRHPLSRWDDLIPKKVQFSNLLIKSFKPDLHQIEQVVLDLNTTRIRGVDQQRRERRERNAEQAQTA